MDYHMLQCLYLCSEKRDRHAHRSVYVSLVRFFLQTELSENYWIRNPCIIHSFYFRLEIKNQKTKKWQLILFFVFESNTKNEKMSGFSYFRSRIQNEKTGSRTEFDFNI